MKRTLVLKLIAILLSSVLCTALLFEIGKADPYDEVQIPSFGTLIIRISSPEDHAYVTNPVNFTVEAGIHSGTIDYFRYKLDSDPWIDLEALNHRETIWLYLSPGLHLVSAEASFFGKTVHANVAFAVDETSPYITLLEPKNKTYTTPEIPLSFETPEPSNLRYVLDGHQPVSISENTSLKGVSDGLHSLILYGTSIFDTNYVSDIIHFEVDTQPPQVTLFPIENNTRNIPLNFTVDESTSWIGYSLDGQANATLVENSTISGLSSGLHELKVYANDTSGNMGASETISFTIEEPFPTTLAIASVIIIAVVSVVLLVYLKKRKR